MIQGHFTGSDDNLNEISLDARFMDPRIKLATPEHPDWADTESDPERRFQLLARHVQVGRVRSERVQHSKGVGCSSVQGDNP